MIELVISLALMVVIALGYYTNLTKSLTIDTYVNNLDSVNFHNRCNVASAISTNIHTLYGDNVSLICSHNLYDKGYTYTDNYGTSYYMVNLNAYTLGIQDTNEYNSVVATFNDLTSFPNIYHLPKINNVKITSKEKKSPFERDFTTRQSVSYYPLLTNNVFNSFNVSYTLDNFTVNYVKSKQEFKIGTVPFDLTGRYLLPLYGQDISWIHNPYKLKIHGVETKGKNGEITKTYNYTSK